MKKFKQFNEEVHQPNVDNTTTPPGTGINKEKVLTPKEIDNNYFKPLLNSLDKIEHKESITELVKYFKSKLDSYVELHNNTNKYNV